MWWSVTLSLVVVSAVSLYLYCRKRYQYFAEREVRSLTPLLLIGSFWRSMLSKNHFLEDFQRGYDTFPNEKYFGAFEGFTPVLHIRDPEIIKKITVKDFDHFVDHKNALFRDDDHMIKDNLFSLKGQKWRDMRGTLSPAFTGSKMRLMVPFMEDISKQVVQYLHDEVKTCNNGKAPEAKELYEFFTRYSNDVIASCAFGYQINSLKEKSNDFYTMGRLITTFNKFKFFLIILFPRLCKMMGLSIFSSKATKFFQNLVSDTMRYRKENSVVRADMIQLLMEAKDGTLKNAPDSRVDDSLGFATVEESEINKAVSNNRKWTDDELAAQAFLFFFAGFETTATALTFTAHELAINPDVQAKLHDEVQRSRAKHARLSYEALQELHYMDMVISETLRKWAGAVLLDRVCQKEYTLEPPHPGGKPYVMKPKDCLYVMVNAIHMDPQYFPEPHKFDPERFSDERKHEIKPFTYMPFGSGPRNCIGSRFALMELKVILHHLLLDFEFATCEKTCNPIRLARGGVKIAAAGGSWVQFKPRN